MKAKHIVTLVLGILVFLLGILLIISRQDIACIGPVVIGLCLIYLSIKGGRTAQLIFGHFAIVVGCVYFTWGLLLLPYAKPELKYIFGMPLFWGMFSIFGGVCAIYHGFCRCLKEKV